jgi:hypothetical protein
MMKNKWNPNITVLVVGVMDGKITKNGAGAQRFADLKDAQTVFPDLNPTAHGPRFTSALGDPETDVMRLETHIAYAILSA